MKDKRLDALLATIYERYNTKPTECYYHEDHKITQFCTHPMVKKPDKDHTAGFNFPITHCEGDIRKCEREG